MKKLITFIWLILLSCGILGNPIELVEETSYLAIEKPESIKNSTDSVVSAISISEVAEINGNNYKRNNKDFSLLTAAPMPATSLRHFNAFKKECSEYSSLFVIL